MQKFSADFILCSIDMSVSNEGISGGKWVFMCLRGRINTIFPVQ